MSDFTNDNTAYLNVSNEIRRVLNEQAAPPLQRDVAVRVQPGLLGRVKIKQHFDAIQRADFADQAFVSIRSYFASACAELDQADEQIKTKFEDMDANAFTCSVVNRALQRGGEAFITIRNNKRGHSGSL